VNKKETKKTLIYFDRAGETATGPVSQKFFAGFFSKKRCFLSSIAPLVARKCGRPYQSGNGRLPWRN
jgi:hypothetical protein